MDKNVVEHLKWIRKEMDNGLCVEVYLDRIIKEHDGIQSSENNKRGEVLRTTSA